MDKSAIVLAGGFSCRFGQDKGLLLLRNKPLVKHVLDAVAGIVDEQLVVVSSKAQCQKYSETLGKDVRILMDRIELHTPLAGALTGFEAAAGTYSLLLPCDTPFVSNGVASFLLELCTNKSAVVPRWPNGYIEPLEAAYCTEVACQAAEKALGEGKFTLQSMIDNMRGVRYVSTLVLEQLDPELKTFFNVNTPLDLKKAEQMFNHDKRAK